MSFIDLMADHVWSDADITNRTEAMVSSRYSAVERDILQRKVSGALLGAHVLTPDEVAAIADFQQVAEDARQAGVDARADMALLQQALDAEAAARRLAVPPADPPTEQDGFERQAAEAVLEAVTPEVQALVDARAAARAPLEPEPQEAPQ